MITHLRGILISKSSTEIVVECSGVGYSALISVNSSSRLGAVGAEINIFTHLAVREDAWQLFAFADAAERDAFRMLISIPGVGGKTAIAMLSSVLVEELQQHVLTGNIHALQKLPGIGKKTAERLVVELRDKIVKLNPGVSIAVDGGHHLLWEEAVAALVTLGYGRPLAEKAVKTALAESAGESNAEILIRKALKHAII